MYLGYFRPFSGKIFAALRIKQALVAEADRDRVATDSTGVTYNVDRGSRTLVLAREREFHQILDERGLRYMKHKRNELFEPRSNVNELIAALRQVRGEEMYLMTKDTVSQDPKYLSQGTNHHHGDRASTTAPAGITCSVADNNVIAQRVGAITFRQPNVVRTFDQPRSLIRRGEEKHYRCARVA